MTTAFLLPLAADHSLALDLPSHKFTALFVRGFAKPFDLRQAAAGSHESLQRLEVGHFLVLRTSPTEPSAHGVNTHHRQQCG